MDDLTEQLRRLGQATERSVRPTTVDEVLDDAAPTTAEVSEHVPQPGRRGAKVLAAAALLVVAALGATTLITRDRGPTELRTASQAGVSGEPWQIPGDDNGWEDLRFCESTSTYDIDTGNTFYGAYQFTYSWFNDTVERLGMEGYQGTWPDDAPPHVQDAVANAIYLEDGADPWPICGRHIDGPMITPVVPQWVGQMSAPLDPAPPMKLSIPSLGLDAPVYGTAANENLALGPVVLGGTEDSPVIAGYGSVDGSVFASIDTVSPGDQIKVSMLQSDGYAEVTRFYEVTAVRTESVHDLPGLTRFPSDLTLVADAADPLDRLVVSTKSVAPDASGYGTTADE